MNSTIMGPLKPLKSRLRMAALRFHLPIPAHRRNRWLMKELIDGQHTMLGRVRLEKLCEICAWPSLPEGAFVECGVARGGALITMHHAGGRGRAMWGFDSFQGMPPLSEEDAGDGTEWVGHQCARADGLADTQRTLKRFGAGAIRLVPGWFEDTLPAHAPRIGPIAILRLDNDWYKSTRFCLEQLYDRVARNGVVIIDDYHTFTGCRRAVDEFRAQRGITDPLVTTAVHSEAYWVKDQA